MARFENRTIEIQPVELCAAIDQIVDARSAIANVQIGGHRVGHGQIVGVGKSRQLSDFDNTRNNDEARIEEIPCDICRQFAAVANFVKHISHKQVFAGHLTKKSRGGGTPLTRGVNRDSETASSIHLRSDPGCAGGFAEARAMAGRVGGIISPRYNHQTPFQNEIIKPPAMTSAPPAIIGRVGNLWNATKLMICQTTNNMAI